MDENSDFLFSEIEQFETFSVVLKKIVSVSSNDSQEDHGLSNYDYCGSIVVILLEKIAVHFLIPKSLGFFFLHIENN